VDINATDKASPFHPHPTLAASPPPVDSQPAAQLPLALSPNLLLDSTEKEEEDDEEDHCAGSAMQRAV
jgi:hypothetical protein